MSEVKPLLADRQLAKWAQWFFNVLSEAQKWPKRSGLLLKGCRDE